MFYGEYQHSLDTKGRLILPSKFRDPFDPGAFVTKTVDGCLAVWTQVEFQRQEADMLEKARRGPNERSAMRSWAAGAAEVTLDKQGRIALPAPLRTYAALESGVTVTGAINHVELWNPDRWRVMEATGSAGLTSGEGLDDMVF